MKRAIIIAAALLLGFAISFSVFLLYNNHEEVIPYDDFIYDNIVVEEDGNFKGRFQIVDVTKRICGYRYEIKDGTLYLSISATAGDRTVLETDENGFVELEFIVEETVEKVVYRCGSEENELEFSEFEEIIT